MMKKIAKVQNIKIPFILTRFIYTFEFSLNFFPYRTTSLFLITVENMAKNKSKIIEKQRKTLQIVKRHKESELNITEYEGQDEEQLRAKIKELKHSAWTVHTNSSYEVILKMVWNGILYIYNSITNLIFRQK